MSRILYSSAWHENAETKIDSKHWGSNLEQGLLPFQIAYLEEIGGWVPFNEGKPLDHIVDDSNKAKETRFKRECFYFPNTVETVKLKGKYLERESGRRAAVYRYIACDIDCHSDVERYEAIDRIKSFPIQYSMLVDSGNGFHVYWELEPIHLLELDEESRCAIEEKYDRIIKSICAYLNGDESKASYLVHALRIPGTWNLKDINNPLQCRIVDKNSRIYSLDEVENLLKETEIYIKRKPGRKKRPPKPSMAFVSKVIADHLRITGQKSFPKHYKRYLTFLLWYRVFPYFVEGQANRKNILGSDGKRIAEAREYFLKNNYIICAEEANRFRKQSAKFILTGKFYDDFGFPKNSGKSKASPEEVCERIRKTDVPKDQRRQFQREAYRELRNAGINHEHCANVILEALNNRSCGKRHSDRQVMSDLNWLNDKFIPIKEKFKK